jgi:hypothetical protein
MSDISKERIERAARAMCEAKGRDPDGYAYVDASSGTGWGVYWLEVMAPLASAVLTSDAPAFAAAEARGRIAGMREAREPTEAMLNAARDWFIKKYGLGVGNDGATGCWQAMLDARIAELTPDPVETK